MYIFIAPFTTYARLDNGTENRLQSGPQIGYCRWCCFLCTDDILIFWYYRQLKITSSAVISEYMWPRIISICQLMWINLIVFVLVTSSLRAMWNNCMKQWLYQVYWMLLLLFKSLFCCRSIFQMFSRRCVNVIT